MALTHRLSGHHQLATLMGQCNELAIFRKFGDLNMINLLSLQAELVDLRDDYYSIIEQDEKDGEEFSTSFAKLRLSENTSNDFQYRKLAEIRDKLNQYNTTLLQVSQVCNHRTPSQRDLSFLQEWLRDSRGGNSSLQDSEAFTWKNTHRLDFTTFQQSPHDEDAFTRWLQTGPVAWYHTIWGEKHSNFAGRVIDVEAGVVHYGGERLEKLAKLMSITIASTAPVLAILGLYFEKDMLKRIYLTIGITAAFAASLSLFTQARRIEIFAATATLAAVEVVFIGSAETLVHSA